MRFKEKIRHYWHELYYHAFPGGGVDFAMRCKDVTAHIDLGDIPEHFSGLLRFRLHLSLCTACHFYFEASRVLKKACQKFVGLHEKTLNIDLLNKRLVEKFSK